MYTDQRIRSAIWRIPRLYRCRDLRDRTDGQEAAKRLTPAARLYRYTARDAVHYLK